MSLRRRTRSEASKPEARAIQITGRARLTPERFLSDCSPATASFLRAQWTEGNQLESGRVPSDGLPAVVILATYARVYGAELVDDYELLIDRFQQHVREVFHPDKFFASCCAILFARGMFPDDESFESINVPSIYEELLS